MRETWEVLTHLVALQSEGVLEIEMLNTMIINIRQLLSQAFGRDVEDEYDPGVIDVVNLRFAELTVSGQPTATLIDFVKAMLKFEVIKETKLKVFLDEPVFVAAGWMDQKTYQKHRSKAITQTLFEQQKFNLLREESEGFAKVIVELNQPNISMENIAVVKGNVAALIGYFNLDPNRILDIVLDSFMNNLWNRQPYVSLLQDYKKPYVAQVLGFKFQGRLEQLTTVLKTAPQPPAEELKAYIPKQLIMLTAVLIAEGAVLLEDVWPHLGTAGETEEAIDEVEQLLLRQIKLVQF